MSDEIPEDIRSQARWVYDRLGRGSDADQDTIAWAMTLATKTEREAMRERCAKIADDEYEAMKRLDMEHVKIHATKSAEICGAKARTAESIAQAIRSSHE